MDGGARRGLSGGGEPLEESALAATEGAGRLFARRGCCCFWVPRFRLAPDTGLGGGTWERIGETGAPGAAEAEESWWRRALMKVREWSEIAAGPRWKTFIRRFNRNHRRGGGSGGGRAETGKFQYDPMSYALNFDEGLGQDGDDDDDYGYRNFSTRYVLQPQTVRASMDLGGRDAPPLFSAA